MGIENKPKWVTEAANNGDIERLSAAGKKGAEARRLKKELREDLTEVEALMQAEQKKAEEIALRESTNEHILPVDID